MSLLDSFDDIAKAQDIDIKFEELFVGDLLGRGNVQAIVMEEIEDVFTKNVHQAKQANINYKTPFAETLCKTIQKITNPKCSSHKSRAIFSIDCRTLRKGNAFRWLSHVAETTKETSDPIIVIENVTQVPIGDSTIYDDPTYVTNLLLRSWKNEHIYAGGIHIDRSNFTVLLTCPPQDENILKKECRQCSYAWIGAYKNNIKDLHELAIKFVDNMT